MNERKNFIQKILEKPRQIITDIKTRQQIEQARQNEFWQQYLTTPPADGEEDTKIFTRSVGLMGGFTSTKYKWDQEKGQWTEIERWGESGYCSH